MVDHSLSPFYVKHVHACSFLREQLDGFENLDLGHLSSSKLVYFSFLVRVEVYDINQMISDVNVSRCKQLSFGQ